MMPEARRTRSRKSAMRVPGNVNGSTDDTALPTTVSRNRRDSWRRILMGAMIAFCA